MNISQILWSLNAVDVLLFLAMVWVVYTGRKDGIVKGIFKLFGVLSTVFIVVHFYARFNAFLKTQFLGKVANELFAFTVLVIVTLAVFWIISKGWDMILKVKILEAVDRIGGLMLTLVQGFFICSLIILGLLMSTTRFVSETAQRSVSQLLIGRTAVEFYKFVHSSLIAKHFTGEKVNKHALQLVGLDKDTVRK